MQSKKKNNVRIKVCHIIFSNSSPVLSLFPGMVRLSANGDDSQHGQQTNFASKD